MQSIKKNFLKCFKFLELVENAEVDTTNRLRVYSTYELAFTNVSYYYEDFSNIEEAIEEDIKYFDKMKVPFLLYFSSDMKVPKDLLKKLSFSYIMNPALEGKIEDLSLSTSSNLIISHFDHMDKADDFYHVFNSVFDIDKNFDGFKIWQERYGFEKSKPLQNFIGYVDGKPIATGTVLTDGDFAGFYNIAVLKGFRKKGYGNEITSHAINYAKNLGSTHAGCYSSPEGLSVYKKLGLKDSHEDYCFFRVSGKS